MKLVEVLNIVVEFHRPYFEKKKNDNKEYFLIALMSFLTLLTIPMMMLMIPFTLYMKLPLITDLIIPIFLAIVPTFAWGNLFIRRFIKYSKFQYTLWFYPERLI